MKIFVSKNSLIGLKKKNVIISLEKNPRVLTTFIPLARRAKLNLPRGSIVMTFWQIDNRFN